MGEFFEEILGGWNPSTRRIAWCDGHGSVDVYVPTPSGGTVGDNHRVSVAFFFFSSYNHDGTPQVPTAVRLCGSAGRDYASNASIGVYLLKASTETTGVHALVFG